MNFKSIQLNKGSFFILLLAMVTFSGKMMAQLTGTKNIPGDYATLALAINDLNTVGVGAGGVTLNVMAGNAETAPMGGYSITATGVAANQISIIGNANTITASATQSVGAINDAVFKIIGGDYITISGFTIQENAANTTTATATNNMTEFGIAVFYVTATDGANNITLQNNTISLNRTYPNTFGIYSNSAHNATAVTTGSTATGATGGNNNLKIYSNTISNVNVAIVVVGPTGTAAHNMGLDIGGSSIAQGNTISNYGTANGFSGYNNVAGNVNGILVKNAGTYNIAYNSITSSVGGTTAGALRGIYVPSYNNAPTAAMIQTIANNTVSLQSGASGGAIDGINIESTTSSALSTVTVSNNNFITSGHTVAGASGTITFLSTTPGCGTLTVNNNRFSNLTVNTTGSVTFVAHGYSMVLGAYQIFNNNAIIGTFSKTGAGGTVTGFTSGTSSVNGSFSIQTNNNLSNITVTGGTGIVGITNSDGASTSPNRTVTGNIFTNWTGGTSAITAFNYNYIGATSTISNNTISNITGQNSVSGIVIGSSFSGGNPLTIANNTITSLSSTGTGGDVVAINSSNTSPIVNINNNSINTLSTTAAVNVRGIVSSGSTITNIFKNKVYDLSGSNAGSVINGILVSGGTTTNVYNNLVGDLRTPAGNSANPLIGISLTGGTTDNLYYNTVYLNGTSSGTNFGSSALSSTGGPTTINLNNNIFINNSTPAGTGIAVAYRRSAAALTNYGTASNHNIYYAGTPSATTAIFYDGTTVQQTLANFKAFVGSTREASSYTENVAFASTTGSASTFLHITNGTSSLAESGAVNIATYTDDVDADVRQGNPGYAGAGTSPDVGADEFAGVSPSPGINTSTVAPAAVQCVAVSHTVTANVAPGALPLTSVYLTYSFNGVAQPTVAMTGGNVNAVSNWTGVIPVANPANATVAWFVTATDGSYTKVMNGTSYSDEPASAFVATATVSPASVCAGSTTSLTLNLSSTNTSTYCAVAAASATGSYFDAFSTTGGVTNITNSASGFSTNGYGIFTSLMASQRLGQAVNFNTTLVGTTVGVAIWVDWDQNGTLDASERVYNTTSYVSASSGTFTVPVTAKLGATRMRIFMDFNNNNPAAPCGPFGSGRGESEDYTFIVLPSSSTYSWDNGVTTFTSSTNPSTVTINASSTYTGTTLISGCPISASVQVISIPLPSAPTTTNSSQCGNGIPMAMVGGGTAYNWYASPTSTIVLQSGASQTYTASISATTSFYVTSAVGACESPRALITATVTQPDAVTATTSAANICPGSTATLTAVQTGTTNVYSYTWTATPAVGSGIATSVVGQSVTVAPTVPGTYVYNVTAFDGVCTTTSVVNVTLSNPPIVNASLTPTMVCSGSTVNLNATTTTIGTGTVAVGNGTSLTGTTEELTSFCNRRINYRMQTVYTAAELMAAGLYAGNISSVTYSISSVGTANTTTAYTVKCGTTAVSAFTDYVSSAGFVTTYTTATRTHTVGINTINFTTPYVWDGVSNLVVEVSHGGADGLYNAETTYSTLATNMTVYGYNSAVTGTPTNKRLNIVFGGQTFAQGAGSLTWQWNPGAINSNTATVAPVNTGTNPATVTYTITGTDPVTTCSNTAVASVTVNPVPTVPVAANSIQCGVGTPSASVSGGATYKWYATPTSTTVLQSGTSASYTAAISGTTTFYVSSYNANCESARAAVTASVNIPDAITATSTSTAVCPGQSFTLTATNTGTNNVYSYTWTATPATGSGMATSVTGSTAAVTPVTAGSYTYKVTGADAVCTTTAAVTVMLSTPPQIIASASPSMSCSGSTVTLNAVTGTIASGTVGIGVSTLTLSAFGDAGNPYNYWYGGQKEQYIFTVAELTAAGLTTGNITSLSFDVVNATALSMNNFSMTVGHTAQTAATFNLITAGLNTVYFNAAQPVTAGINNYVFSTPFNWNGTDNIVVSLSWSNVNGGNTALTPSVRAHNAGFASTAYLYADNTAAAAIAAATTTLSAGIGGTSQNNFTNNRPNIIFTGQRLTQGAAGINWQWNPGAVNSNTTTVAPTTTGTSIMPTYTVTAVDPVTTCSNTAVVTLTVNPIPTVSVAASTASICSGTTASLTATGATTYSWMPAGGTSSVAVVSPTANTVYTVTGTSLGCANTQTVNLNVTTTPTVVASASPSVICSGATLTLTASGATTYSWMPNSSASGTVTATPTVSTIYTVTGTSLGCSNTKTVSTTVNTVPTLTITTNPANGALCTTGATATLTATGTSTAYVWSTPANTASTSVAPSATTVYSVTGTNSCGAVTKTVTIAVATTPTITAATSSTLSCASNSVVLTANATPGVTYLWSTGPGTPSITVSPSVTTTYTVTGTNACGSATATIVQNVSPCVGIEEVTGADAISIYPNPASDYVNIAIPASLTSGNTTVEVTDALGKLVMKETLNTDVTTLKTNTLTDGIYFFKVISNNQTIKVGKVVKH